MITVKLVSTTQVGYWIMTTFEDGQQFGDSMIVNLEDESPSDYVSRWAKKLNG